MTNFKISLLIIDPQNDFCDIPEAERPMLENGMQLSPALPVSGADGDMKRLAAFIERAGDRLCDIHVTLDSHNPVDIAHPSWWRDAAGAAPAPFTVISAAEVHATVADALDAWARKRLENIDFVTKGSNPYTEHYSHGPNVM